ncbi:CaiB/BaiF CoA transferase family protein [Phytoactinopolyspora mesophila]|uniref:CoA transferase n=1 Tax=Phytoactinopolyspora mesophila TaxID=2650750 RepID=A0A7K3M9L4_9ACTN|nr:CaiB/BaiF CoA-transferase family protein [Phytoactinopolyspora mesophila]NDL59687.1 CoA transferase [Phytoactinopolyspora mesophila]
MTGPLAGLRVVELAGLGPAPHAAMVLADLGAEVVRIERRSAGDVASAMGDVAQAMTGATAGRDQMQRGKLLIGADLKDPAGLRGVLALVSHADVLLEGFRPGVADRLGLGPADCLERNPRLIYGRMTGWGQDGPFAQRAGHDINYLALTGALHAMGRPGERPAPPLNLAGDFGGGSMLLLTGVLAALWERTRSGHGQVVDAAMTDGVGLLLQLTWSMRGLGMWTDERGSNLFDGGAPFYDTYECADGRYVAVGALEQQFYAQLLDGLGLDAAELPDRGQRENWPALRERFAAVFASRTRDEWADTFNGTDACVTPVLRFDEVAAHPHNAARAGVIERDGVTQAAPAPRFSRTPADLPAPDPWGSGRPEPGDVDSVLTRWRSHDH